jgi:hypothetical protein
MCWNPEVSITTYLFSLVSSLLAINYGVISFQKFLVINAFVSMQLIEFFLWLNLNNKPINKLLSILGFIAVLSIPYFSMSLIQNNKVKQTILLTYFTFVLFIIFSQKIVFETVVGKNGHFEWKWLNFPFFIVLIWFFFLCFENLYYFYINGLNVNAKWVGHLCALLYIIITAVTSYIYFLDSKTWGSMWCWFANIIGIFLLIKTFLIKNKLF